MSIKEYTPTAAIERFSFLLCNGTDYWYDYGRTKNFKKGEVIEIFTKSKASLKLPFDSITGTCLYSLNLGKNYSAFLRFAVEKSFRDALYLRSGGAIAVDLSKLTKIRHYENVFFPAAIKEEVQSTLLTYTKLPSSLIYLINEWLPSYEEEEGDTLIKYNKEQDKYAVGQGDILPQELRPSAVFSADNLKEKGIDIGAAGDLSHIYKW